MDKLSNTFKVVKLARHEAVKNGELEIKLKRGYGPTEKKERHFLTWVTDRVHTHISSFHMESDEEESILRGIDTDTKTSLSRDANPCKARTSRPPKTYLDSL